MIKNFKYRIKVMREKIYRVLRSARYILFLVSASILFLGCGTSSFDKEMESDHNDIDIPDSDPDSTLEQEDTDFYEYEDNDSLEFDDNGFEPIDQDDDSLPDEEYISVCEPNPCKAKNKTVCREIDDHGVFHLDVEYFCACNEGWIGFKCDRCQKGYYGPDCKPCSCGNNEECNDGLDGDGGCSCLKETLPDGTCPCLPGWSGEKCEIFGANWECSKIGQPCSTTGDCCHNAVCMVSLADDQRLCRKKKRYGSEEVRKLDISKDGRLVATSRMGAIRIHCAKTLNELFRLSIGVSSTAVAFSPDGALLALDESGSLVLRDMNDRSILDTRSRSYLRSLEFSPDGVLLAAAHSGGTTVYNVVNGSLKENFHFEGTADSVSFTSDGLLLAIGSGSMTHGINVWIYSMEDGEFIKSLSVNEYYLEVAFSPDNKMLAVGGYEYNYKPPVNIFNVNNNWDLYRNVELYFNEIHSLSFDRSSEYLAIGERALGVIYSLKENFVPLISLGWQQKFSLDGKFLISGGEQGFLMRYSVPWFDLEASTLNGNLRPLTLSVDGTNQILSGYPSSIIFTEAVTGEVVRELEVTETIWNYLYFKESDNGQYGCFHRGYSGGAKGFLIVDLNDGEVFFKNTEVSAEAFSFSPDNKVFAVFDKNLSETSVYSMATFEILFSIQHENDKVVSDIQFSPDGRAVAIVENNRAVVYDRTDGTKKFTMIESGLPVYFPDGTKIAVANGTVRVYSATDGSRVFDTQFEKSGKMVRFSGDGRYMITDNGIYEIKTGSFSGFTTHYYGINAVDISSGSRVVLTRGKDTTRIIDMSGVIDPYEGECRKDSECDEYSFCNSRFRRCFLDITSIPSVKEGEVKWSYDVGPDTYIYYSSPALSNDEHTIYFGTSVKVRSNPSRNDAFIALKRDGSLKWSYELTGGEEVRSSPVVSGGKVCFTADYRTGEFSKDYSSLFCLDKVDGEPVFVKRISDNSSMLSSGLSKVVSANDKIFVIMEYLYVFDVDSGDELYKSNRLQTNDVYVNPVVLDLEVMFILDGKLYFVAIDDYTTRTVDISAINTSNVLSTPALDSNKNIYFGTETGEIIALDKDGDLLWKRDFNPLNSFNGPFVRSSVAVNESNGAVYAGTKANEESKFIALNITDGKTLWEFETGRDIYSSPLIGANGKIYFGSESRYLYALHPDGSLSWKTDVSQDITWPSPAIDSNGVLYIGGMGNGSGNGKLFAIQTDSAGLLDGSWPKIHKNNQNTAN